jgi:hypothetical protein
MRIHLHGMKYTMAAETAQNPMTANSVMGVRHCGDHRVTPRSTNQAAAGSLQADIRK